MKVRSSFPLARSQSFSVLSQLPESAVRPSGAMATLLTPVGVPGEGAQLFSAGEVPELQRLVPDSPRARFGRPGQWRRCSPPSECPVKMRSSFPLARSQSFSVLSSLPESAVRPSGAMATLAHSVGVPGEGAQLLSAGQVPELQRLVLTPRERGSAVRGNGDAVTASECPVKVRSSFPLARSQSFSVLSSLPESAVRPSGAMATLAHSVGVPGEGAQLFSAGQVPELQRLVPAPRERGSAVRGNGDAVHPIGVPGEGAQLFSAGQVPELQRLVPLPESAVRPSGAMATLVTRRSAR